LTTNPFAVMVKMHEEWVKTVTENGGNNYESW
jgi:hypothetical protein